MLHNVNQNASVPFLDTFAKRSYYLAAGWSSLEARRAHNPKVEGSNPSPATNHINTLRSTHLFLFIYDSGFSHGWDTNKTVV